MRKRTSFHKAIHKPIVHEHMSYSLAIVRKHTSFMILYRPTRKGDGDNTTATTTSYVGIKPLMHRRTSFISHCVLLFNDNNT
jgi:hypothetical protein